MEWNGKRWDGGDSYYSTVRGGFSVLLVFGVFGFLLLFRNDSVGDYHLV